MDGKSRRRKWFSLLEIFRQATHRCGSDGFMTAALLYQVRLVGQEQSPACGTGRHPDPWFRSHRPGFSPESGKHKKERHDPCSFTRGLFPQPHQPCQSYPPFLDPENFPNTALDLLRRVRSEIRHAIGLGGDWRSVVDSIRPFTQHLWQELTLGERRKSIRHLRSYWEPHRHRAAPQALAVKQTSETQGRLQCHCGRVVGIRETADGLHVVFKNAPPGTNLF